MTTPPDETRPEYRHRMSDDGGGGLEDVPGTEANIETSFLDLGTLYTSPASIPSTATVRPAGTFTDARDAREYLEIGGLVGGSGGSVIPLGFVYFLQEFDEYLWENTYTVYIDENS